MTLADRWQATLSSGITPTFSPSGHALAVLPRMLREPYARALDVHFTDGREPLIATFDNAVTWLAWASDDDLVYRDWDSIEEDAASTLRVFSVESGKTRPLMDTGDRMDVVYSGLPGHLSVLAEPEGQAGLFDLDVHTGAFERLSAFDAALERLVVYPLFGHALCHARQEVALIAWPRSDYLPPDAEPTEANSRRFASRDDPFRLFLLDAKGGCQEVAGTHNAHHPLWSPDGDALTFERYDHHGSLNKPVSVKGVWLARRSDLSLTRLGGRGGLVLTVMHPSGVLLCQLEDESIPFNADKGRARLRSARWTGFALRGGEARPE